MEKKYSKILLTLFLVNISTVCCSNKQSTQKKSTADTNVISNLPDTEIYDFSYKHTNKDKIIWELFSKIGKVFDRKGIIEIEGVNLNFYKNNKPDSTITSKYGQIDEHKDILTAISNVVLTTSDGTVLYTDLLHWDNNKSLLYTEKFVKIIKQNGDIIKGIGMEADNQLEKLIIKRNVSGTIYEKK